MPSNRNAHTERDDMEQLLLTIEASLRIRTRPEFYLWSQGGLQHFLPHETLLCAHGDVTRLSFHVETFSSIVFTPPMERAITDRVSGVVARALVAWMGNGQAPLLRDGSAAHGTSGATREADQPDLGHLAAHGPGDMLGGGGSFFAFLRMPQGPGPREAHHLSVLVPFLHMALYRVLHQDQANRAPVPSRGRLSRREIEVLKWVRDGKTNDEVGMILGISTPTVKNHMQKILRKLGVSNRAHAVARAAELGLVLPDE